MNPFATEEINRPPTPPDLKSPSGHHEDPVVGDSLRLFAEDIDFNGIDEDLERFQKDEIIKQALDQGIDLRGYAKQIDSELKEVELISVKEYVAQADSLVELSQQIETCDATLARMQEMLLGFQADLGGISDEIKHLQDESVTMNIKLRNRRAAEGRLGRFLERVVVAPDLARVLCQGEVATPQFLAAVAELAAVSAHLTAPAAAGAAAEAKAGGHGGGEGVGAAWGPAPARTAAGREVGPRLAKLRAKAVVRIREYFLRAVGALRAPKTNVAVLQREALARYAPLLAFLQRHAPAVAEEVRRAYVDILGRNVHSLFKAYRAALGRLEAPGPAAADTLVPAEAPGAAAAALGFLSGVAAAAAQQYSGGGEGGEGGGGGGGAGGPSAVAAAAAGGGKADPFALRGRDAVLAQVGEPPALVHVLQAEAAAAAAGASRRGGGGGGRLTAEEAHRSLMAHLLDCASAEYLFDLEFFGKFAAEVFEGVFSRTKQLILETLENHLFTCHDAVGLLLLIRLTAAHRRLMQRRMVPAMDTLLDQISMMLWPRFKFVFDNHRNSVTSARLRRPGGAGGAALLPHQATRRYAELAAAVLTLCAPPPGADGGGGGGGAWGQLGGGAAAAVPIGVAGAAALASAPGAAAGGGEEMVLNDLGALRRAVVDFLARAADQLPSAKQRAVFLVNNCDLVLTVLAERRAGQGGGGSASSSVVSAGGLRTDDAPQAEAPKWEAMLAQHRAAFVEEELMDRYARLIAFVRQAEAVHAARRQGGGAADGGGAAAAAEGGGVDERTAQMLARDFAASWKSSIESINQDVLSYFANFKNGMEVLKQVLTQLLLYYSRFQEIIRKTWRKLPPWSKDLVSTAQILVEIKKYSRSF